MLGLGGGTQSVSRTQAPGIWRGCRCVSCSCKLEPRARGWVPLAGDPDGYPPSRGLRGHGSAQTEGTTAALCSCRHIQFSAAARGALQYFNCDNLLTLQLLVLYMLASTADKLPHIACGVTPKQAGSCADAERAM